MKVGAILAAVATPVAAFGLRDCPSPGPVEGRPASAPALGHEA